MLATTTAQNQKPGSLPLIAEVEHDVFWSFLKKADRPVVLTVRSGVPRAYKYLTRYEGYYFVTKSKEPLDFSQIAEVIPTNKIIMTPQWPNL